WPAAADAVSDNFIFLQRTGELLPGPFSVNMSFPLHTVFSLRPFFLLFLLLFASDTIQIYLIKGVSFYHQSMIFFLHFFLLSQVSVVSYDGFFSPVISGRETTYDLKKQKGAYLHGP